VLASAVAAFFCPTGGTLQRERETLSGIHLRTVSMFKTGWIIRILDEHRGVFILELVHRLLKIKGLRENYSILRCSYLSL